MWINVGGRLTLKKLLRVLLRIILTPSICWGNTSGEKNSQITTITTLLLFSMYFLPCGQQHLFNHVAWTRHCLFFSKKYLCSSCGESESCQGWVGGHLSSPSVVDCPSEQDVRPSEKEGGPKRKASSDGPDRKTKPERCPCGRNTSYKTQRVKGEIYDDAVIHLFFPTCSLYLHCLKPYSVLHEDDRCKHEPYPEIQFKERIKDIFQSKNIYIIVHYCTNTNTQRLKIGIESRV